MQMTVISAGKADPHAGWVAIDELSALISAYFGAPWLSPAPGPDSLVRRALGRSRPRFQPVGALQGDVLFVVARGPADLALVQAVPNVRQRFGKIHAFVTDSYFTAGYPAETALYDSISVTAHEDMAYPGDRFGVKVHHLHQGIDGLRWSPDPLAPRQRDIDLIAYGRTPPSYHRALVDRFHAPASPYLYLHSPLGHVRGADVSAERGMLFKLLHRTHLSLAFHLLVEPEVQRPRSMMVTSRWLESLLSGCLVAGRRPVSRMADEMLCWPGATLELKDTPQELAEEVEDLLARRNDWTAQRRLNTANTLRHHDWRWRLRALCGLHGWDEPRMLGADLQAVSARADQFAM
ncbi:MAG: glycosyltransferase [Aquabacterium sp.]|nr:glycosyltransferase [Aquabacterium sp.]